jgi:hypothetical protein
LTIFGLETVIGNKMSGFPRFLNKPNFFLKLMLWRRTMEILRKSGTAGIQNRSLAMNQFAILFEV